METDYQVLCFIHERLVHRHLEPEIVDYMHALRRIIAATDPDVRSPEFGSNSLNELRMRLAQPRMDAIAAKYGYEG